MPQGAVLAAVVFSVLVVAVVTIYRGAGSVETVAETAVELERGERVARSRDEFRKRALAKSPVRSRKHAKVRRKVNPAPVRRVAGEGSSMADVDEFSGDEQSETESAGNDVGRVPDIQAGDYIAALRESGETAGLAAFPPPGISPPRSGVVVPDDYDLPEGFARHYQTTDDGRRLDPVLIVAPGYEIVDEIGDPVPLPDRVVPPEFAPLDLPLEMLEIPPVPDLAEDSD